MSTLLAHKQEDAEAKDKAKLELRIAKEAGAANRRYHDGVPGGMTEAVRPLVTRIVELETLTNDMSREWGRDKAKLTEAQAETERAKTKWVAENQAKIEANNQRDKVIKREGEILEDLSRTHNEREALKAELANTKNALTDAELQCRDLAAALDIEKRTHAIELANIRRERDLARGCIDGLLDLIQRRGLS